MISKIAIFRALYLGDMLCIIPTARAVRNAYPEAHITLIGLPWQSDFAKRFNRYFNDFIEFPGWPGLPEQEPDTEKIIAFLNHIRTMKFDLVLQMQGNGMLTNAMCMLWGAKKVCGLRREGEYAPYEGLFPLSSDEDHEILRFLKLTASLGIATAGSYLEFPITDEEADKARHILRDSGLINSRYVCIHPGARDPRRRWPVENFAHVANTIATHGFSIVLTGSSGEKTLLEDLRARINGPVLNIVETFGHLSAGELAALLQASRLLVSNDTGVSHIAAAVGLPSVIVFSPYSHYERWKPLDTKKHIAVPFEKAKDTAHVLHYSREMLGLTVSEFS